MNNTFLSNIANKICKTLGHRWRYKDYSNFMKPNGDKYDFTAARNCTRCSQHAYYYNTWKNEGKSKFDFESDFYASKTININEVMYS